MSKLHVLVTGAQGALGSVVFRKFSESGHLVTGTDARSVNAKNFIQADLSSPASVQSLVTQTALLGQGKVDVLVHCAGGFRYANVDQTSDEDFEFLLNANFKSTFYLTRALLPLMKKSGFGRMVFIGAKAALTPPAGMGAYCGTKAALAALVSSLTEETKGFNITANVLMPTLIDTPTNRRDMPNSDFSKWVKPEELAEIAYSLTQTLGNPVRGAMIPVSGQV